jgi:hypothetical protein
MIRLGHLMLIMGSALLFLRGQAVCQPQIADSSSPAKLKQTDIAKLRSSADKGDATAERKLAEAYDKGNGVSKNDALAAAWYRKSADQGDAKAQNSLGVMYRLGRGVSKSMEDAVRWYRAAAKQGYAEAMFNLGAAYYNGDGVPSDLDLSYAWFLLAREAGDDAAKDAVARGAQEMKSTVEALENLGAMYEKGEELPRNPAEAIRWYGEAAKESDPAKLNLAEKLIQGRSLPRDYAQALDLCRAASDHEYAPGQYCVGYLYQHGLGVETNPIEAVKWYKLAAAPGFRASREPGIHPGGARQQATLALAEMYARGDGVPVDRSEAYYWFVIAYVAGASEAKPQCRSLLPQMSKDEIKQLEKKLRNDRLDPQKVFTLMSEGQ